MAKFKLPKLKLPMPARLKTLKLPFRRPDLKDPITQKKLIIYALMFVTFGTVLTIGMVGVVNIPESCIVCHSENPEYQTWKRSSHANVNCRSCHTPPGGPLPFLYDEVSAIWKSVIPALTGGGEQPHNPHSEVSQGHIPNAVCLRCHSPETRTFTPSRDVKMDSKAHKTHLKKGVRCTTCHNRVTHEDAEKYDPIPKWAKNFRYKNFTHMIEGCFRCHRKGRIDVAQQKVTFVETDELDERLHASLKPVEAKIEEETNENLKALFEAEKKAEEEGEKLTQASRRCDLCHPDDFDLKPKSHGVENWAPAGPPQQGAERVRWAHAEEGKKTSPVTCYQCHLKTFCLDCHATEMPHPRPWKDRHGKAVVASVTPLPKPDFVADQPFSFVDIQMAPVPVLNNPQSLFCYRCHSSSENFCKKCHGVSFPHPTGWRSAHGKTAMAPLQAPPAVELAPKLVGQVGRAACETCHRPQFCDGCHGGAPLPHPSNWLTEHRIFLKDRDPKVCTTCHDIQGCEKCHSAHKVHNRQRLYDFSNF